MGLRRYEARANLALSPVAEEDPVAEEGPVAEEASARGLMAPAPNPPEPGWSLPFAAPQYPRGGQPSPRFMAAPPRSGQPEWAFPFAVPELRGPVVEAPVQHAGGIQWFIPLEGEADFGERDGQAGPIGTGIQEQEGAASVRNVTFGQGSSGSQPTEEDVANVLFSLQRLVYMLDAQMAICERRCRLVEAMGSQLMPDVPLEVASTWNFKLGLQSDILTAIADVMDDELNN